MTTLFLDVDGVVSPLPESRRPPRTWPRWRKVPDSLHCLVSQDMADALGALPVELVWLTTWEDLANEVICPALGWEPLPVVERRLYDEEPWWKLNAVLEHVRAGGGPFIWADDDILSEPAIEQLHGCGTDHVLINPDWRVGLTPEHLEVAGAWVASLSGVS